MGLATPTREVGMLRTATRFSVLWWVLGCLLLLGAGPALVGWRLAFAQIPSPSGTTVEEKLLRFRRVFVLADRLSEVPRESVPYVPVEPEEFEQLIRLILEQRGPDRRTSSAFVQTARYYARLEGGNLVDGQAILEVAPFGKETGIPPVYRLEPLSLAAGGISWADRDGQPARAGWCAAGKYKVLVDGPGVLMFPWTCAGYRQPEGTIVFPLKFPEAVQTRLTVDAPAEFLPQADGLLWCEGNPTANVRRWVFELGGRSQWELVWLPETLAVTRPLVALWLGYEVGPQGLDLTVQVQLQTGERPLEELRFHMGAELEVVEVTAPGSESSWHVRANGDDSQVRELIVRFSPPLKGYGQLARIRAVGPVQIGRRWSLPFFEYRGSGWERTALQVNIRPPIEVGGFRLQGGRQIAGSSSGRYSDVLFAVYDRPNGRAEIELFIPPPLYTAWELSLGEFGSKVHKSRVAIAVKALQGEVWNLSARIAPGWFVETLHPEQPSIIAGWRVEDPGPEGGTEHRLLFIDLARPLPSDQWIAFSVECTRVCNENVDRYTVRNLIPIEWPEARDTRILLAFLGEWPWATGRISRQGGELDTGDSPLPKLRQLVDVADDHPIWRLEDIVEASFQVHPVPRYKARAQTVWDLEADVAVGRSWILCWPEEGAAIDRVTLSFWPASEKQRKWSVYTLDHRDALDQLQALIGEETLRPLPFRVQREAVPEGELWHVVLDSPTRSPVVIVHSATVPIKPGDLLEIFWLPEAAKQDLFLGLSRAGEHWVLEDLEGGLKPTWNPGPSMPRLDFGSPGSRTPGNIVWLQYSTPSANGAGFPKIVLKKDYGKLFPEAVAWGQVGHSWIRPGEPPRHRADFLVEIRSQKTVNFRWEQPVRLLAVQVNGRTLKEPESLRKASIAKYLPVGASDFEEFTPDRQGTANGNPPATDQTGEGICRDFPVTLEQRERFVWVTLLWDDPEPARGHVLSVPLPRVSVDIPVLDYRWVVWTPPEYVAQVVDEKGISIVPVTFQRLFGIMARPAEEPVFDPFVREAWWELLGEPIAKARAVEGMEQWKEIVVYLAGTEEQAKGENRTSSGNEISTGVERPLPSESARDREAQAGIRPQEGLGVMSGQETPPQATITWGELLTALEELAGGLPSNFVAVPGDERQRKVRFSQRPEIPGPLLVDVAAFEELGIHPDTPLPREELARGKPILELIREAGLAVLLHPRAWVLTGAAQAEAVAKGLDPIRFGRSDFYRKALGHPTGSPREVAGAENLPSLTQRGENPAVGGLSVQIVSYPGHEPTLREGNSLLTRPATLYRSPTPERLLALFVPDGKEEGVLAKVFHKLGGSTPRFLPASVWARRWQPGPAGRPAEVRFGELGGRGWHATVCRSGPGDGVQVRVYARSLEGLIRWGMAIFISGLVAALRLSGPMPTIYWLVAGGAILAGMIGDPLLAAGAGGVLLGEIIGVLLGVFCLRKQTQSSRRQDEGYGKGPEPPAGPPGPPGDASVRGDIQGSMSKIGPSSLLEDTAICRAQQAGSAEGTTMTMPTAYPPSTESSQSVSEGLVEPVPPQRNPEEAKFSEARGCNLPDLSRTEAGRNREDSLRLPWGSGRGTILFALIAALASLGGEGISKGEELGPGGPSVEPTYRVLIPADGTGRPTGEKYQVPEPMWSRLTQLAAEASDRWLLSAARYRVRIGPSPDRLGWWITELRVTFEVEVLQAPTSMPLPIQPLPGMVVGSVTINGRPVIPTVSELDGRLTAEFLSAGKNELEMTLVPEQTVTTTDGSLRLPIPPLPQSWLQCTYPSEIRMVEVLKSVGPVVSRPGGGLVEANLGPVEELWLRWSARGDGTGAPEARMLLLLGLRPEGLSADLSLRFLDPSAIPERVEVEIDPEWQVEEVPPTRLEILDPGSPTRPKRIVWWSQESEGLRQFGKLRLLLPIPDFAGQVFLSFVSLPQVRVTSRWIAAATAAEAQIQPVSSEFVEPLALSAFTESWGEPVPTLAAAWNVPPERTTAAFLIRWSSGRVAVREFLGAFLKIGRIQLNYFADLEPQNLAIFRYQWDVPPDFVVEGVEVQQNGDSTAPIKILWSEDHKLVVVPEKPLGNPHRVRVKGWVPIPVGEEVVLPIIRLLGYQSGPIKVDIWASSDCLTTLKFEGPLLPQPWFSEASLAQDRFLGGLEVDPDRETGVRMVVRSNRPEVMAKQITRADRGREGWFVEVIWLLNISGGNLESLDLTVPAWTWEELSVDPAGQIVPLSFSEESGQAGGKGSGQVTSDRKVFPFPEEASEKLAAGPSGVPKVLGQIRGGYPRDLCTNEQYSEGIRVEFERPLTGTRTVRLLWRGGLTGRRLRIPLVQIHDATVTEHFLLVPDRPDLRILRCPFGRLKEETVPPEATDLFPGTQYRCYHLSGEVDRVVMVVGVGEPVVTGVWVRAQVTSDKEIIGLAGYDIDPAGRPQLRLRVPSSLQLLGIYVHGGYWQAEDTDGRLWRVVLPHQTLPGQVLVFFRGKAELENSWWPVNSIRLKIPAFENCRVRETWWQLGGEDNGLWTGTLRSSGGSTVLRACGALEVGVARLQSLAAMLRLATAELPALGPDEFGWFPGWFKLWHAAEVEALRELWLPASQQEELQAELASIRSAVVTLMTQWNEQLSRWGYQLSGGDDRLTSTNHQPRREEGDEIFPPWQNAVDGVWPAALLPASSFRVWMDPEGGTEVLLELWPDWIDDLLGILLGVALALVCIGLAGVGSFRRSLLGFFVGLPWVGVVLAGMGWWLWFRPSALGFALMVMGAVGGISQYFRKVF